MSNNNQKKTRFRTDMKSLPSALMLTSFLMSPMASAIQFELADGEVTGSLDTTLGVAAAWRTSAPKTDQAIPTRPNTMSDATFGTGQVSQVYKVGLDLGLQWENYGFQASAGGFYDSFIMDKGRGDAQSLQGWPGFSVAPQDKWSKDAERASGKDFSVNTAYLYGTWDFENVAGIEYLPVEVRVGKQFTNWGEGMYFVDGISVAAPLNINQLSLPGAEVKDAFLGLNAVRLQAGLGDNLSVDAYYQLEWERSKFPGIGTFYGDDNLGPGNTEELPNVWDAPEDAKDSGQWGLSMRYTLDDWEFGLYHSTYHEHNPNFAFEYDLTNPDLPYGAKARQIYPESVRMYGASFVTTAGPVAVAGEIAWRPNAALVGSYLEESLGAGLSDSVDRRETLNASVNFMYGHGAAMSFDSNFFVLQVGLDHLSGDTSKLPGNSWVSEETIYADKNAWGVAADWSGIWQNVMPGVDVSPGLFLQYDVDGYSHYWGNFSEKRLRGAARVVASYLNNFEAQLSYNWADSGNSNYDYQDTVNLSVNYKF